MQLYGHMMLWVEDAQVTFKVSHDITRTRDQSII